MPKSNNYLSKFYDTNNLEKYLAWGEYVDHHFNFYTFDEDQNVLFTCKAFEVYALS